MKSDITSPYLYCGNISELSHNLKLFFSYNIHYIPPLAVLSHWAHDVDAINQCCCLVQYLIVAYLSNCTLLYIRSRRLLPYLLWPFLYPVFHYYTAEAAAYYLTFMALSISGFTLLYSRSSCLLPYLLWPCLYLVLHYYIAEVAANCLTFYGHVYIWFFTII